MIIRQGILNKPINNKEKQTNDKFYELNPLKIIKIIDQEVIKAFILCNKNKKLYVYYLLVACCWKKMCGWACFPPTIRRDLEWNWVELDGLVLKYYKVLNTVQSKEYHQGIRTWCLSEVFNVRRENSPSGNLNFCGPFRVMCFWI